MMNETQTEILIFVGAILFIVSFIALLGMPTINIIKSEYGFVDYCNDLGYQNYEHDDGFYFCYNISDGELHKHYFKWEDVGE